MEVPKIILIQIVTLTLMTLLMFVVYQTYLTILPPVQVSLNAVVWQRPLRDIHIPYQDVPRPKLKSLYAFGHSDISTRVCSNQGEETKVVLAITSAPSNSSARTAIRESWGQASNRSDVVILFFVGKTNDDIYNSKVIEEQVMYGDIVREDNIDAYEFLPLKVLSMMEWIARYCPKAKFGFKTDDDTFFNIQLLLKFVDEHDENDDVIYGSLLDHLTPNRKKNVKNSATREEFSLDIFPPFLRGGGYIFPARLAEKIFLTALEYSFLKFEDIFFTGYIASHLNVKLHHEQSLVYFAADKDRSFPALTICDTQRYVAINGLNHSIQRYFWDEISKINPNEC